MLNKQSFTDRFYEIIYHHSPDGIFIADSTGNYIEVNPAACELTGYPHEELIRMNLSDILHPDSRSEVISIFENLKSIGKISTECKHIKKDGTICYMQVDAVKFDNDTYIGFCKDTTKRRLHEEACTELEIRKQLEDELLLKKKQLESKNEELEAILESMSDGLVMVNKDFSVTFLNQRGRDFFYKPETVKNGADFPYTKCYNQQDKLIQFDEMGSVRALKGEKIKSERIKVVHPDKTLYYSMSGNPIYGESGEIDAAIVCCRDITEQVKNEELIFQQSIQLLKTEKEKNEVLTKAIEMKDDFLSTISHEFKTPLTVINSAIQAMEFFCKDELSERSKGYIKKIKQNAFRQLRLVNNLLDITRANAGQIKISMERVDIVFYIKSILDSVNIYAQQKGLEIKFATELKSKFLYLDEEKFERIMLNLISNAIKFTSTGKVITVRLLTKVVNKKSYVCIEVIDHGVGIPKDMQSIIFEKFGQVDSSLTRQAEGTGIGLSLVKKFVEVHDGMIQVDSEVGIGSTFTVLLPILKEHNQSEIKRYADSKDSRLIQSAVIEFSDIYF